MKKQVSFKDEIVQALMSLIYIIGYGWVIYMFWNELMPHIFSLPVINYQQGILIAASVDILCFNLKRVFK